MELRNKFEIGQEVYTVIRKPIQYDCPVCNGTGKFNHNGYDVKCPHCNGVGKLTDKKTLWNVVENKVSIRSIRANIHGADLQSIKYKVSCKSDYRIDSRPESQLFFTVEEAEKFCYIGNHPIGNADCRTCKNHPENNNGFAPPHTCDICTSLDQEDFTMYEKQ